MPRYLKQELKSAIMATPNCAFPKRGNKGDHTDGNSSLPRVLRPGHERTSRHHQAGSKDQRPPHCGSAHQQREEPPVHRRGAGGAAAGVLQGHPERDGGEL